jgi:hypothetical protein
MKQLFTLLTAMVFLTFGTSLMAQESLEFIINSPGGIAGTIEVGPPAADFGGNLGPGESISGDLVRVEADTTAAEPADDTPLMGCDSIVNGMTVMGNVALISRGSCFFSDKVWYAQQAGAVAAVICNINPGEGVITMGSGGDFAGQATIPSGFLSYEDCEAIYAELDMGNTVNITMRVPAFYNAITSYSFHTPESQILPMDAMSVNIVNADADPASNVEVYLDITDPDGNLTSFTETIETLDGLVDSAVTFDVYTPTVQGEYTAVFSNNLNSDVINEAFVITADIFAPDAGEITGFAGPSDEQFATNNSFAYYYASLAQTNDNPAVAAQVSFGIGNAADIVTGNPDFDVITVVLYNGDADGDNVLDFNTSFDDLTPIALGNYQITGDEGTEELIFVNLISFTGDPIELPANGAYYASIQYNGDPVEAPSAPAFLSTRDVNYPINLTNALYLEQLYTGWAGERVACRLHLDITNNTQDLTFLAEDKFQLISNPADEFVGLDLQLAEMANEVQVDIISYMGQVISTQVLNNVQRGTYEFDTKNLTDGYYFLSVKTPEGYRSIPFVVAH